MGRLSCLNIPLTEISVEWTNSTPGGYKIVCRSEGLYSPRIMQAMSLGCCRYWGSITGSLDGSSSFSVTVPLLEGSRQEAKSTKPSCVMLWWYGNMARNVCRKYQLNVTATATILPNCVKIKKKKKNSFKYLGSIATDVGTHDKDIQKKISGVNIVTKTLYQILWNENIYSRKLRKIYFTP